MSAELSHLSQFRFGHELVERGIARLYAEEDAGKVRVWAAGGASLFRKIEIRVLN